MKSHNSNDYNNAEFEANESNNENDKNINGKPMTFKTGEVAEMLGETAAMTRYYCREFEDYMTLNHKPGEHRLYTEKNIQELKYILSLIKDDGLTVKQIHEYLSSPQGKIASPIFDQQEKMKILINSMVEKVDDRLQEIVKREMENTFALTVKKVLDNTFENIASKDDLKSVSENIEKIKEEIIKNNKKGFFSRLFSKN